VRHWVGMGVRMHADFWGGLWVCGRTGWLMWCGETGVLWIGICGALLCVLHWWVGQVVVMVIVAAYRVMVELEE